MSRLGRAAPSRLESKIRPAAPRGLAAFPTKLYLGLLARHLVARETMAPYRRFGTWRYMATHSENKARRREQILRAARALMTESETADFSMELLAQRAGVAIATPYKLLGSKNQVVVALHAWETGRFSEQIDKLDEPDPVLRLLKSVDVAIDIHLSDEPYFKALSRAAFTAMQPVQEYYNTERDRFFLNALQAMSAAGLIRAGHDIGLLATALAHQYFACVRGWASGGTPSHELHARMGHALSLTLAAVVVPSRGEAMNSLALEHQKSLLSSRQSAPAPCEPAKVTECVGEICD